MATWVKNKKDNFNNLTIAFSGRNIKNYLILAIKSFLYFYPDLKDNIIVFDDNSIDGTREWLKEQNIKIITWSDYTEKFRNIKHRIKGSWNFRISMLINEIILQTNTKYLCILDGDIVFLQNKIFKNSINDLNKYSVIGIEINPLKLGHFYLFLNRDKLIKHEILYDNLEHAIKQYDNVGLFCEGDIFIKLLNEKKISYKLYSEKQFNENIFHFKLISTINYYIYNNRNIDKKFLNFTKELNKNIDVFNSINNIDFIHNIIKNNKINLIGFNDYKK
ncbi:MAG: glycosyltransferase family A protein [archaeon]